MLLIEDDSGIRQATTRALTDQDRAVITSNSGMRTQESAVDNAPDVVRFHLGLPDLTAAGSRDASGGQRGAGVIIITARNDDVDIVKAPHAAADDYVVKAFGIGQVDAWLRAVLRREWRRGR